MKKEAFKKDELKELLGSMPSGGFEEVKLAFAKFGTELSPEQEARLKGLLENKRSV